MTTHVVPAPSPRNVLTIPPQAPRWVVLSALFESRRDRGLRVRIPGQQSTFAVTSGREVAAGPGWSLRKEIPWIRRTFFAPVFPLPQCSV